MLVSIDTLKEYLGLPEAEDAVKDPILERSTRIAQTLASAYCGVPLELDTAVKVHHIRYIITPCSVVRLPVYPVVFSSVKIDDVEVGTSAYRADKKLGLVQFVPPQSYVNKLDITYSPGFLPEECPPDILEAITSIAVAIYENGGSPPAPSASANALKSMTMFDAMSMSFDTSGVTAGAAESLVTQWAFVLDKYKVDKYVMV